MAEYLEEQLKRMSPRVRRTRRKQTERETGGGKEDKTHRSERTQQNPKHSQHASLCSMNHDEHTALTQSSKQCTHTAKRSDVYNFSL